MGSYLSDPSNPDAVPSLVYPAHLQCFDSLRSGEWLNIISQTRRNSATIFSIMANAIWVKIDG